MPNGYHHLDDPEVLESKLWSAKVGLIFSIILNLLVIAALVHCHVHHEHGRQTREVVR